MSDITIKQARDVALRLAARHGVVVVTPDHSDLEREGTLLAISAASSLSLSEARNRVSFYVPKIVDDIKALIPAPARDLLTGSAIFISPAAWDDAVALLGVMAHELGHHNRDEATRDAQGILGSVLWGAAYLVHPTVRGYEESTCYICDLVMRVVVAGEPPIVVAQGVKEALGGYKLSLQGSRLAGRVLASASRSLMSHELPGVNTTAHEMLKELVADGWDPGPWRTAICGGP